MEKNCQGFAFSLKNLFSRSSPNIANFLPELEDTLLKADVGVAMTGQLINSIKNQSFDTADRCLTFLKETIIGCLLPKAPFVLSHERPAVILFVGVNGTGKTTSIGKLAHFYKHRGMQVMMVAADTFRAAATAQLKVWADRTSSLFVEGGARCDPASVIFSGIQQGRSLKVDLILVDTAGRLHTKTSLMDELKKGVRVAGKALGRAPDEIFLVLDATIGQNGLAQAREFLAAIPVSGLILAKYDGTSKGGIILAIVKETGLPLRFVGMGEGVEDLQEFVAREFVEEMFR